MAKIDTSPIVEQNPNNLAGVNFDTAIYGTAAGIPPVVRLGRDVLPGGVYVVAGVQTSVNAIVIMDLVNARPGVAVTIKRPPSAVSTSVITVLSGSAAGGTAGVLGTSTAGEVTTVFDGVAGVWR
jgi:hypothetical protein